MADKLTFHTGFKFTIDDQFVVYEFFLPISNKHSIDDIADTIYKAFGLKKEDGKCVHSHFKLKDND